MLQSNFTEGVACLNRILNHAAQTQMSLGGNWEPGNSTEGSDLPGVLMSIAGQPRYYAGTHNTWLWYRGTGIGPYPCMSALQALELLCDKILEEEAMPPSQLIRTLLSGCENLAMPALVYGLMVRHVEGFGSLIDPFLTEPSVWQLEATRVSQEYSGVAARATPPKLEMAVERRKWTVDETVSRLVLAGSESRREELKDVGITYFERAKKEIKGTPRAAEQLALAQRRAMTFDVDQYETVQADDHVLIRQRSDPQIEAALAESDAQFQHDGSAWQLLNRHAALNDYYQDSDPLDVEEIRRHITIARDLLANPPENGPPDSNDAPALVAAAVLEVHFLGDIPMEANDLVWATRVLTDIVEEQRMHLASDSSDPYSVLSGYGWGASLSAARGLPLLLNSEAQPILDLLDAEGLSEGQLYKALTWVFTNAPNEARCAASHALDSVWQSPCSSSGKCRHQIAFDFVEQSIQHSVFRTRWQPIEYEPQSRWRRLLRLRRRFRWHTPIHELSHLDGPIIEELASAPADCLIVSLLNPALRALGGEARNPTCVHSQAAALLDAVLEAHRRARKTTDVGWSPDRWCALHAARAILARAVAGDESALWTHIEGLADHDDGLYELLMALAAAAEESPEAAATASETWPLIIRKCIRILAKADRCNSFPDFEQGPTKVFSALMPVPIPNFLYMYRELPDDGPVTWIDPKTWTPEIELWISTAIKGATGADSTSIQQQSAVIPSFPAGGFFGTIDSLIGTLSTLPIAQQAEAGINWVEQLAEAAGEDVVDTIRLRQWLHDVEPHCIGETKESRQRIVDFMYVHGGWRDPQTSD